ncbi:MAG: hypothetical protein ACKERG_02730 [Candidatus Hodgkinia cicadicola]
MRCLSQLVWGVSYDGVRLEAEADWLIVAEEGELNLEVRPRCEAYQFLHSSRPAGGLLSPGAPFSFAWTPPPSQSLIDQPDAI